MELKFLEAIDQKEKLLCDAADFIWDHPELAFHEFECSQYLCQILEQEGFSVKKGLAGIETAFSGTYGSGKPVIGILGEFDALCGLHQSANATVKDSDNRGNGHGCGHNLLAGCTLGAALGIKEYLKSTGKSGTVIFFGCPAEEGGSGKTFMAREGVFDCLDAALSMHPDRLTGVRARTSLANSQVLFQFDGVASHASLQPHLGRSALDAVALMNVGTNFLREHIIDEARVHYAVTDAGGNAPNVVQAHAEVLYLIRAPKNEQVKDITQRIYKIAEGAALMTETTVTPRFIKACSNTVLNHAIQEVLYENMKDIGVPEPSAEDMAYAKKLTEEALMQFPKADPARPIHHELVAYNGEEEKGSGSTDVGDVSWICPTAQAMASMYAMGTPNHSWQQTTQSRNNWAHKMMIYVAKSLCATGVALLEDPELLERAKKEHKERIGPNGYCCPIPADVIPNSMSN